MFFHSTMHWTCQTHSMIISNIIVIIDIDTLYVVMLPGKLLQNLIVSSSSTPGIS